MSACAVFTSARTFVCKTSQGNASMGSFSGAAKRKLASLALSGLAMRTRLVTAAASEAFQARRNNRRKGS